MFDIQTESTNILITKAYHPDLSRPADNCVFDRSCALSQIRTNENALITKNKFDFLSDNIGECRSKINQLLSDCYNSYNPERNFKNEFFIDYEYLTNFRTDLDETLDNYGGNGDLNQVVISYVTHLKQSLIEFKTNEPKFILDLNALNDLNRINGFDTAMKFYDMYGFAYPFTSYETNQFKIVTLVLSSYNISDSNVLVNLARNYFETDKKRALGKNAHYEFINGHGMVRFESNVIDTPQLFKCNSKVYWIPLWELIKKSLNSNLILNENIIKYLRDSWLIRDASYLLTLKIFENDLLKSQIEQNYTFNFKKFWFDTFMQHVYLKFKNFLDDNFYAKNLFINDFANDCKLYKFLTKLSNRANIYIKILEIISNKSFFYEEFNAYCQTKYINLYYSQNWIDKDPNTWLGILNEVKNLIERDNLSCILIDNDFYLRKENLNSLIIESKYLKEVEIQSEVVNEDRILTVRDHSGFDFNNIFKDIYTEKSIFIYMRNNYFFYINNFTFSIGLREKLVEIDLSRNYLFVLDEGCFDGMVNLKRLNMSKNYLSKIQSNFKNLKKLEYLNLSLNRISQIDEDSFNGLDNLIYLNLSNNNLKLIPNVLGLKRIEELNLGGNSISSVSRELEGLKTLKTLYLSHNSIEILKFYSFRDLKNVEFLFLNSNQLRKIDPRAFLDMKKLKILYLFDNENLNDGDFRRLYFSSDPYERLMYVFKNEQFSLVTQYFEKDFKYFGFSCEITKLNDSDYSIFDSDYYICQKQIRV
ncbi:unnamed protein product [Brachionus calyciflorus]|uniref:Uncharacterized protein n=1 Tax=Brachionus calyciflorus TaxID=104777 RepID=A0A814CHM2_9BILA|nr:unnamed protein product [Brachionus calyciflorus]